MPFFVIPINVTLLTISRSFPDCCKHTLCMYAHTYAYQWHCVLQKGKKNIICMTKFINEMINLCGPVSVSKCLIGLDPTWS